MKLALLTCHFNPCNYQSRTRNLHQFLTGIITDGLAPDLFIAECLFPGQQPTLGGDVPYHLTTVQATSVIWQKEALLNQLAANLPPEYTHIVILDADLLLPPDFIGTVRAALKASPLLQPWDRASELDPEGRELRVRASTTNGIRRGSLPDRLTDWECYHPGHCWAMHRSFYTDGPGLCQAHIGGSSDTLLAFGMLDCPFEHHPNFQQFSPSFRQQIFTHIQQIRDWRTAQKAPPIPPDLLPSLLKNPILLQVLSHGHLADRGYHSIRTILAEFDPLIHLLEAGTTSPLEWSEEALATALPGDILTWFQNRYEDGPPPPPLDIADMESTPTPEPDPACEPPSSSSSSLDSSPPAPSSLPLEESAPPIPISPASLS